MSEPFNPYAPPAASLSPDLGAGGVWRSGKTLVMRVGAELPHRCVKCNAPAEEPLKERKVYWHHPALYILALFALLIYALVALAVRKQATIAPGLCAEHRKRRALWIVLGCLSPVVGIALIVLGAGQDGCGLMATGGLTLLVGIVGALIMARIVYPERIDQEYVRLLGCSEAFLSSLPEFHG